MSIEKLIIPENYHSSLSIFDTQIAIKVIKDTFEQELAKKLNLRRVSAPLFVSIDSGLNDNLSGIERPVGFDVNGLEVPCEIVHSLAKWKRMALKQYDFYVGNGLYTDMNAIRRDEELDNLHSVYVDQWDWEKVIEYQDRTEEYLKKTVTAIMQALKDTERVLHHRFPELKEVIEEEVYFITSEELLQKYPTLSAKEREDAIVKEHHTVFIQQIGAPLSDGKPHDGRAPDYDDWSLNGDLIVYNEILDRAFEISSMGIRVDEKALLSQLESAGCLERSTLPFHLSLLNGQLPLTIGGGIGQSRICMLLLQKAHIGEVQVSIWSPEMRKICQDHGIFLL